MNRTTFPGRWVSCTIVIVGLMLCVPAAAQSVKKVKIEELAAYIQSSDHPLVVNFWATWCAPCIEEIPYFQKEIKKYAGQRAELLLVSLDFPDAYRTKLPAFIKKHNYEATFFWLDETNADHFCPKIDPKWDGAIPATLFVNNKKSYRKFFGRQLTEPQFVLNMQELVK